jgi:hypothetical protein
VQKHLRDIKASRYGPNYACNQESSLDFEQFDLPAAATKDANSPADDSEVSDARAQHLPTQHPTSSPSSPPAPSSARALLSETTTVGCNNCPQLRARFSGSSWLEHVLHPLALASTR